MNPPGLKAAYVIVAPQSSFLESTFIGGAFKESMISGWMNGQDAGGQVAMLRARVKMDDGWERTDFIHHIDEVRIPMYNVGGWYDIFGEGSVSNFMYLQDKGRRGLDRSRRSDADRGSNGDLFATQGGSCQRRCRPHWRRSR